MIADILMYGSVIGYFMIWVLYFLACEYGNLTETQQTAFFIYAVAPWTSIVTFTGAYISKCL